MKRLDGWGVLAVAAVACGGCAAGDPRTASLAMMASAADELRVHFIDVGQGDCTLIECPGGGVILVDCGSLGGGDRDRVKAYIRERLDANAPRIDTLILTHPDADHYNLLDDVLDGVTVGKVLMTGTSDEYSSGDFSAWLDEHESIVKRLRPTDFDTTDGEPKYCGCGDAQVRILAADVAAAASPTNARSIVALVQYEDFDVLLTGDATFDTENVILGRYDQAWLECEVLKIGHHGSETTSTSEAWAAAISPEAAIVSAGYSNRFAHPRKKVIQRLTPFTAAENAHPMRWGWSEGTTAKFENLPDFTEAIYSTATNGDIVVSSDGTEYAIAFDQRARTQPR
ncbi:MAG: hypothetical protein FLDDKLPJ_02770 [Phycisphaerae bacterium]|nr:hypothetical protein [Phycisphaerae bacterium]